MKLSTLILEAICLADQNEETKNCNCKGKQILSIDCLRDCNHIFSPCKFISISKSRSTIALTNENGTVINANEFFGGFKIDKKEYLEKEQNWIDKCGKIIDEL